jgi:hypothetical protein
MLSGFIAVPRIATTKGAGYPLGYPAPSAGSFGVGF